MQNTTIAAIATAPGAGGIAVVRLSGPESYAVAARVFRPANPNKNVEEAKGYTALFGSFVEGDDAFDEGVALFFREPHSYTGEDVVELSCHGGSAVARRLVEACIAAGAAPAAPGEYTRRAFLNGKMSLTQAEAVMDIISADGKQGAALANASLSGAGIFINAFRAWFGAAAYQHYSCECRGADLPEFHNKAPPGNQFSYTNYILFSIFCQQDFIFL